MKNVISIDCGGTNLRVAVVDENLNILAIRKENTVRNNPEKLYQTIKGLIDEVAKEAKIDKIDAIGFSMCGIVMNNVVERVGNLGIEHFDFLPLFKKDFPGVKVSIANDGNCSALVEAEYGVNKGLVNSAFVTISTGIGLGVIHKGEMIDMPLEGGRLMQEYKGNIYEAEYLLSGNGIVNLAKLNGLQISSAKEFFDGIREKDEKILSLYDIWVRMLGLWFANIQLLFNLDQYALSGGVMKSEDIFLDDLTHIANAFIAAWHIKPIKFVDSKFRQDVGTMAAASLALHILNK